MDSDFENVKGNREKNENYRCDPPDHFDPSRFHGRTKLTPNEFIVIEIGLRQIETIMDTRVEPPAGVMISAANRAGERATWDVLAADRTDHGRFEFQPGHFLEAT